MNKWMIAVAGPTDDPTAPTMNMFECMSCGVVVFMPNDGQWHRTTCQCGQNIEVEQPRGA